MLQTLAESGVECIVQAHGGGGELTGRLVAEHCLPQLSNSTLNALTDGAVVRWGSKQVVFTTDSYVVSPLEFPGGDIGRLAVCGTVNDLAVMGANPVALSLGLILEEGLPIATLDRIMASIANAAEEACISIVTGDTKVIDRRDGNGLFINTAGIGHLLPNANFCIENVRSGDAVIISRPIAEHGLTIMARRAGIEFETSLRSDAAPLNGLIAKLIEHNPNIHFIRDATRGGIAGVLADICERSGLSLEIDEESIPMSVTAKHAAEMLGLDPLGVANEGVIVVVVPEDSASQTLAIIHHHQYGKQAAIVGRVTDAVPPLVELRTVAGGARIVQRPYGEELPRIC